MLNVFFTVDVEVWCDGWHNLDADFPEAFQRYIYGQTPNGDFGVPYTVRTLCEHGLVGVFYVEPLFATRFGVEPLAEIVGILSEADQDVELHLHTEWVDESHQALLDNVSHKRQNLRDFSLDEQTALIEAGADLLKRAGAESITSFRAGNFGFNLDTLRALAANGIEFDSSYNACKNGVDSGVLPGATVTEPIRCENVYEYPMTVFNDGTGSLRHAQLTACSYNELKGLLWKALEAERSAFVILSHNFELLNPAKTRCDDVVVKRFQQLCSFLDHNRDSFCVRGFPGLKPQVTERQPDPLASPAWTTGARMLEQLTRRRYE